MNVNQNFKNQMWAAQIGTPNARVQLENYILWLGSRRQFEINSLSLKCNNDTLGYETDSLINYLSSSDILNDRIIRYNLLINKGDYNTALAELSVITSLTGDMTYEMQSEYNDFRNISEIFINVLQMPENAGDSLILSNQAYLESIAEAEFHVAQSEAKTLLEKADIPQVNLVWLPDGLTPRNSRITVDKTDSEISELCKNLAVYPNPSNGNIVVKYDINNKESSAVITLTSTEGKLMAKQKLSDTKGEIQINCNVCITGNYVLTLYVDGQKQCTKELNIKK